jgi:lauroyl/myristoyl acyltransferase
MFAGPPGFERFIAALRPLPRPLSVGALAALSLADGIARRRRYRSAVHWAESQGCQGWRRHGLAVRLLANHGRYVADEALLGVRRTGELGVNVRVEGREHLDDSGGALLLGFHLGPPKLWLALRAAGLPVIFAGNLARSRDARWQQVFAAGAAIDLSGAIETRTAAMYRIRKEIVRGGLCYMTADGPFGREAFRIDLPGRALVIRSGWLALRRSAGARVIPVLTHAADGCRHVVFHQPLPPADADPRRDAEACAAALTPIIAAYVRRYPTQCRWLAIDGRASEG